MKIHLEPIQAAAHRAIQPTSTVCLPWGRGGGKSHFQRLQWYLAVAKWDGQLRPGAAEPGVRIVLFMPTLEQAKKVHADKMIGELEGPWAFLGAKVNRNDWRITFPGGSWIQWVSAVRADNARGIRCDMVSLDEADDLEANVVDSVIVPWFSEPHSLKITIPSGTPRKGRHGYLHKMHAAGVAGLPGHHSFHATYRDFPHFIDQAYAEKVRASMSPEIFKREWECDFSASEGLVYSTFLEDFHVREPEPGTVWSEVIVGMDHGWEDPGVILVIGLQGSGRDTTAHVLGEVYAQHKTEDWWVEQARQIAGWYPHAKWFSDPSRPDRNNAVAKKAGVRMCQTNNSILDGVDTVQNMLAVRESGGREYAHLYVSPRCKNTIAEIHLYRRKRNPRNTEEVLEDIEDKNNHAMDALRYALHSRLGQFFGGSGRRHSSLERRAS